MSPRIPSPIAAIASMCAVQVVFAMAWSPAYWRIARPVAAPRTA